MTALKATIKRATEIAYEEDAWQVVGRVDGRWVIAHADDLGRQAQMVEPRFGVDAEGVDPLHIDLGEITPEWELPA